MSSRKLPNKVSTEELLNLLNEETQEQISQVDPEVSIDESDILGFLSAYDIQPGEYPIKSTFLYKLYKEWSFQPVTRQKFGHCVCNFFIRPNTTHLLINKDYFTICRELYILYQDSRIDKRKIPAYRKHFEQFLKIHKIEPGRYWVESFILFYLYDKWSYEKKSRKKLGYKTFHNFCRLYFKYKRRTADRHDWFQVDKSLLNHITEDKINEIRLARKKYYEKEYPKRKRQIPIS